jgi:anti-anti-sigma factor
VLGRVGAVHHRVCGPTSTRPSRPPAPENQVEPDPGYAKAGLAVCGGTRTMEALSLMCRDLPGVTLLSVGGELDLATSEQLEMYCRRVCRPGDHVIFDLARLRFMDCSGLRALIHAHHHVRQGGGVVHLSGLRPGPARVVAIAHIDAVMPVHADLDAAIRAAVGSRGAGRHRLARSPRRSSRVAARRPVR